MFKCFIIKTKKNDTFSKIIDPYFQNNITKTKDFFELEKDALLSLKGVGEITAEKITEIITSEVQNS